MRIVVFAGITAPAYARRALEAGAAGYVLKMTGVDAVADALRQVASGLRYLDPLLGAEFLVPTGVLMSDREVQVLQAMAHGQQNGVIAHELSISVDTVKAHVSKIRLKLDVDSRTAAVALGIRAGMVR